MPQEKLIFDYSSPKTLLLKLSGDWRIFAGLPSEKNVALQLDAHPEIAKIVFNLSQDLKWDSGLISFFRLLIRECTSRNILIDREALPEGLQKMLALALTVKERIGPSKVAQDRSFARVGNKVLQLYYGTVSLLDFLGHITVSFGRLITGKAYFPREDFIYILQRCGVDSLALISLISVLVGMILAFVGAIQLQMFGAQIFIADIVGIAMVRVLAAVMTGIIMSGRIGASFAAELGIMQTNEEIDAFRTLGIDPIEYLVMPRLLALVIMMPVLTIYADLMGILGGFVISAGMLGLNPVEYWDHTQTAVKLKFLWIGLIHSFVFGVIVAVSGCLRGMKCERSAAGVGEATTSAVVTAITSIVIATAIITYVCQLLGV
ncbi:MAG: ABC transporter permease [Candidatus Omnitrophica bacterium]|nr:ABC transporter permease [Candidatus Omnitrophota bacterium]